MTEPTLCPRCSAAVQPEQAFCAICGAPLSSGSASQAGAAEVGRAVGDAPAAAPAPRRARARGSKDGAAEAAQTKLADAPDAPDAPGFSPPDADPGDAPSDAIDPRLAALGLVPGRAPSAAATPAPPAAATDAWSAPAPDVFNAAPPTFAVPTFAPPVAAQAARPEAAAAMPAPDPEPELEPDPEPEPELAVARPERIPGGYLPPSISPEEAPWALRPSSTSSTARPSGAGMSLTVGAIPVSPLAREELDQADLPAEPPTPTWPARPLAVAASQAPLEAPFQSPIRPAAPPAPTFAPPPVVAASPFARPVPQVLGAPPARPAAPAPELAPAKEPETIAVPEAPAKPERKESIQELVAFGLVAGGAVVGIAGLFLPWANSDGIGIGNYTNKIPESNQWGLGMPAGIFLLLLTAVVLGAASGSDRAKERLPNLSAVIGQVTDLIMPMILGAMYLGVFLLYLTLPSGFGMGVFSMLLGGGLLIAGAIVTLFFPPEAAPDTETTAD